MTPAADDSDISAAVQRHRAGDLDAAAALYRAILQRQPEHVQAMQLLGALAGQQGRLDESLALLQRAAELMPDSPAVQNNLGTAHAFGGQHEQALACFDRALALDPRHLSALANRGQALRRMERLVEALQCYDALLALQPDSAAATLNRGELLAKLSTLRMRSRDEAVACLRRAAELGADAQDVAFALAALGAQAVPASAPRDYVARLFDAYAPRFEQHLTEELNYRTPQQMAAALQACGVAPSRQVVDLGCGTGLCAPLLRPLAEHLVGVDLSPRMLDMARERGLYDELQCADVTEHLQGLAPGATGLVVAADVLVYIGELQPLLAAAARALQVGGHLAVSVETHDGAGFVLLPTRRYAHAVDCVRAQAAAAGLQLRHQQAVVLREDLGQDVNGAVLVLQR